MPVLVNCLVPQPPEQDTFPVSQGTCSSCMAYGMYATGQQIQLLQHALVKGEKRCMAGQQVQFSSMA